MFSGLRQGCQLYILEKGENTALKIGVVESVSNPTPKFSSTYAPGYGEMVVDIKVNVDGQTMEFNQIPSNLSIANFGTSNVVIAESKEAILTELDGMSRTSQQVLDSVPYHENVVASCNTIAKRLNPTIAREQERDEAITTLKTEMADIKSSLKEILKSLPKPAKP